MLTVVQDSASPRTRGGPQVWPWGQVALAALAMVATLPGRTHGVGLITEPLLKDLRLDRIDYGHINLWATLAGALFCIPFGWLTDRLAPRRTLATTTALLGLVVLLMSALPADPVVFPWYGIDLFVLVVLTRGLGQSALSVGSLALMGRVAGPRGALAMGVYAFLVTLGFMGAFAAVKVALGSWEVGWRQLWASIGGVLLVAVAPAFALLVRDRAALGGGSSDDPEASSSADRSLNLAAALRTPAFWVFALGTSLYGLVAAGVSLFNQSILEERHFNRDVFLNITTFTPLVGLASNLLTGWLATRVRMGRLLALAMAVLAGALISFPAVTTETEVYCYAAAMGVAGGAVTVIFFGAWVKLFGPAHLGRIQGAAQLLTVVASAVGPLLLAESKVWYGSYVPLFEMFAGAAAVLGVCSWLIRKENP